MAAVAALGACRDAPRHAPIRGDAAAGQRPRDFGDTPPAPRWRAELASAAAEPLTWAVGPRVRATVRVASSAVGAVELDPMTGAVVARDPDAPRPPPRPADEMGVLRANGLACRLGRAALRCAGATGAWSAPIEPAIDAGGAGPVAAGGAVAVVADEALIAFAAGDGRRLWRAPGRYATAPGALAADAAGRLRAIAVDGGAQPVAIVPATGAVAARGDRVPALVVWAAAFAPDGAAAVVVRRDASLRRDAVVAFGADGRRRWTWPLPPPDGARVDRPGVAVADGAVFVFYDGRSVARLDL